MGGAAMTCAIDRGPRASFPRAANPCPARRSAALGEVAARMPSRRRTAAMLLGLCLLLLVLSVVSCAVGRYPVSPRTALAILFNELLPMASDGARETEAVVLGIRLPRILGAILVGSALSIAGVAYQGLFRNPMVSPSILGVSAGAGLGAALATRLDLGSDL
jgi:ABC-type Fe3+-siderophore transport system permease subunit